MYVPTLARFTARDPMPPDGEPVLLAASPYGYAQNNPVNFVDPSGLAPEETGKKGKRKKPENYFFPPPEHELDPSVKGCKCGEALNCLWLVGDACAQAKQLANEALAAAQATGLPGAHNGQQDAFRHCYWSCTMTAAFGGGKAKTIGDLHEECGQGPANETCMDLWNNAIGRHRGDLIRRTKFDDPKKKCRKYCLAALSDSSLQSSPGCPPGEGTAYDAD